MLGDHMVTIEDQRASLASLAHGAKRPVKKLEEMTSVAQVIDHADAATEKLTTQLGLPVEIEDTDRLRAAEKTCRFSAAALTEKPIHKMAVVVQNSELMAETIWTATLATLQTTGEKEQPTTLSEALNKAGSDELEQLATDIQTAVQTVMLGEGALDKLFAVTHTPMNTDETETRIEPLMTNAQKMLDTLREDVKAAHDQDREDLQEHVNKIQDALRRINKLTQVSPGATEEIAYHDAKEAVKIAKMKGLYLRVEQELRTLAKVERRQRKLREAEVAAIDLEDSDEDTGPPEDGDDDPEAESHVPSDMPTDPHAIQEAIKMCEMRAERVQKELRTIVLEAFDSTKQGTDGSKEKSTTSDDLKELANHTYGSRTKSAREPKYGKKMCSIHKEAALKKPNEWCATAPMLAVWFTTNVSVSDFRVATVERVNEYVDMKDFENPWGMGPLTMARFGDEAKQWFDLQLAAAPAVIRDSTGPDNNFDPTVRNEKIKLRAVREDGPSYIEMWKVQEEYQTPRQMEGLRLAVGGIRKLFYKVPLAKSIPTAIAIVRKAVELEARVAWVQTGALWVDIIGAVHREIKPDLLANRLNRLPEGIDELHCISCLEQLLADILATSDRIAGLRDNDPKELTEAHELYFTVDDHEIAAIMDTQAQRAPRQNTSSGPPTGKNVTCQVTLRDTTGNCTPCERALGRRELALHEDLCKRTGQQLRPICSSHRKNVQLRRTVASGRTYSSHGRKVTNRPITMARSSCGLTRENQSHTTTSGCRPNNSSLEH
jgi:hypothetical protein